MLGFINLSKEDIDLIVDRRPAKPRPRVERPHGRRPR